jgi:hypothetical protein
MILARVAYDACSQQFRLADPEMASIFQEGELYLLFVDFLPKPGADHSVIEVDFTLPMDPPPPMGQA